MQALLQRRLDRPGRVGEDVPEQEDEDAGRESVEEPLHRLRQPSHARDRKAEEYRSARDGPE